MSFTAPTKQFGLPFGYTFKSEKPGGAGADGQEPPLCLQHGQREKQVVSIHLREGQITRLPSSTCVNIMNNFVKIYL